jgi:hypothetical protein
VPIPPSSHSSLRFDCECPEGTSKLQQSRGLPPVVDMSIKRAIEKKIIEGDGDEQIILSFYHSIKRAIDKELVSETKETDNKNRLTHSMKRPQLMAAAFSRIISMIIYSLI